MQYLVLIHRWLGVVLCLLFCAWFISGIVMIYYPFPSLSEQLRLQKTESITTNKSLLPIHSFWSENLANPQKITLVSVLGEPYYWWRSKDNERVNTVHAVTGDPLMFNNEQIVQIAQQFYPDIPIEKVQADVEYDQWIVSNKFDSYRPFYRIEFDDKDKTSIYISSRNAKVLQKTTQSQRRWNYVGAVIHWIYPTALRKHWAAWDQLVWWLALIGIVGAVTGIVLGVIRTIQARRTLSSFDGWLRWHHISGLVLGIVVFSWIFSGWLSMDHGRIFSKPNPTEKQLKLFQNIPTTENFKRLPSLAHVYALTNVKEIEFRVIAGNPYLVTKSAPRGNKVWTVNDQLNWHLAENGLPIQWMREATQIAWPNMSINDMHYIEDNDTYTNLREGKLGENVLRVILDNSANTWIHIHKQSGEVVSVMDDGRRVYRWLFNGLHSLDFPSLTSRPLLWYIVILTLLILGALFSLTGTVLGIRRLLK